MAKATTARNKNEASMLNSIGGRGQAPAAADSGAKAPAKVPGKGASIGWIGYVGGALWAVVLCAAGGTAILIAFGGG